MVSYSGHGLISGYTPDPNVPKKEELIQPYYGIVAYSYNNFRGIEPQKYEWSFERQPDVIVINLDKSVKDLYSPGIYNVN